MVKQTIALEGIEILAPIGCYEEERKNKNTFIINVEIEVAFVENTNANDLNNTVNYETIYQIVEREMRIECYLMEDVIRRILDAIQKIDSNILSIEIVIRKKNPPLQGNVNFSKVALFWSKK